MRALTAVTVTSLALVSVFALAQGCGGTNGGSGFGETPDGSSQNDATSLLGDGASLNNDAGSLFGDAALFGDSGCATAKASAARQPVYMLVVLDGSGSMAIDPTTMQPVQKWAAAVPALDAFFDDLNAKADNSFGVGLLVFSDKNDPSCFGRACSGTYNGLTSPNIPIKFVDSAQDTALKGRIDNTMPFDGTPTVAVLQSMYPVLQSYQPAAPLQQGGKKVLVLMTDGVPNDLAGTDQATLQQEAIQLAQQNFKNDQITTFAVGIGDLPNPPDTANYDPAFMGALAVAGGAPNANCNPSETQDATKMCHFQITPGSKTAQQLEQDFLNAINQIRNAVASCDFVLSKTGNIDPTKVNVIYNDGMGGGDMLIPQNPTNGWSYDNPQSPTKVTLNGGACTNFKSDPKATIQIVLGCATVVK